MRARIVVLACGALACDSNTGPRLPVIPPLGNYAYSFANPADSNGVIAARSFSGTLVLTYATADSIAGHWEVSGFAPQPFGGGRGLDVGFCAVDSCPVPGSRPVGSSTDSLPYQLGAVVVDATSADSAVPVLHFFFWQRDRVLCAAFRFGIVDQRPVGVLGNCTLDLPTTSGAAAK